MALPPIVSYGCQGHNTAALIRNTRLIFRCVSSTKRTAASTTPASTTAARTAAASTDTASTTPASTAAASTTLASTSRSTTEDPNNSGTALATVVQGPSLVHTGVYRPSPSLMMLPGLRSLPYWTSIQNNVNRVAYQDPMLTRVVEYVESKAALVREEYIQVQHQQQSPPPPTQQSPHTTTTNATINNNNNNKTVHSDYDLASATSGTEHANNSAGGKDPLHTGSWDWHSYMLKGQLQPKFQDHFPQTAGILQPLRDEGLLFDRTPFGFCFLSALHPESTIRAHTAPMNFRLRLHLPLIVPTTTTTTATNTNSRTTLSDSSLKTTHGLSCGMRVGDAVRPWTTDKALVFDDAYEHEVWNHHTDQTRVLLLIDLWHPDVTQPEREKIVAMFQHAQDQGWLGEDSDA